jgi:hypothetical protein
MTRTTFGRVVGFRETVGVAQPVAIHALATADPMKSRRLSFISGISFTPVIGRIRPIGPIRPIGLKQRVRALPTPWFGIDPGGL